MLAPQIGVIPDTGAPVLLTGPIEGASIVISNVGGLAQILTPDQGVKADAWIYCGATSESSSPAVGAGIAFLLLSGASITLPCSTAIGALGRGSPVTLTWIVGT